jgi:hypothetical protein
MRKNASFHWIAGSIFIVLGGFLIVYFFFQPWIEVNLKIKSISYTGLQLATSESLMIFIVPVLAILTILFNFYYLIKKKAAYKFISSIASIFGLIFMILLFTQMNSRVIHLMEKMRIFKYSWGIVAVLMGFLIQLTGNFITSFRKDTSEVVPGNIK